MSMGVLDAAMGKGDTVHYRDLSMYISEKVHAVSFL